ncbi:MAG: hypothetical protein J7J61_03215 [Candidatus Hydrothermae bacterium]|nr:hypothetical protein [Candidatus Hydrothermae bacterium]
MLVPEYVKSKTLKLTNEIDKLFETIKDNAYDYNVARILLNLNKKLK